MRIAALTTGPTVPSTRVRVRQHLPLLRARGLEIVEYCPPLGGRRFRPPFLAGVRGRYLAPLFGLELAALLLQRLPGIFGSLRADVTWLERSFVPMLEGAAFILGRPLVVDIDDAIWLYNPFGRASIGRLIRRADAVIAGNSFLANWCGEYCRNVHVVPTAVDASKFCPRVFARQVDSKFVVGWTGSSATLSYLEGIESVLVRFMDRVPNAKLLIVADRAPRFSQIRSEQILFHKWTPDNEYTLVQDMDVGIMPLEDSDIARGKCSFKMLQYMACGLPVVVSPVGMNGEILRSETVGFGAQNSDEWVESLYTYYRQPELRDKHGRAGRDLVLRKFDLAVVGQQLADIFVRKIA